MEIRLNYLRKNVNRIAREDAEVMGREYVSDSENVLLPSSFLGSRRWTSTQVADTLAIASQFGPPTFFITMTCNPEWPEIQGQLQPGQDYTDIPTIVVRVFREKLRLLIKVRMYQTNASLSLIVICADS